MAKKMMNQIRSCEAEPEALMARPSDMLPFSVYTVALTACTAQQELISPECPDDASVSANARARDGPCSIHKSCISSSQDQLSCRH